MGYREYTPDEVEEMIEYADYDPDDYEDWTQLGFILNDYDDNLGFDLWDQWSARSSKYDPQETAYKWDTFNSEGKNALTMGTLVKKAKDNGYIPETKKSKEIDWDDEIGEGEKEPVYSGDPVENARIKARLRAKKRAEPYDAERGTATRTQVNDNTNSVLDRVINALESETGTYQKLVDVALKTMETNEEAQNYYKARGISEKTRKHYNAGWIENLGYDSITGPVIPGSFEGYGQRNIHYEEQIKKIENSNLSEQEKKTAKGKIRKYNKPSTKNGALDIPIGLKHVIRQPEPRDSAGFVEPLFIFEGYFDVLSFYEASGLDGISLNGTGSIRKVIDVLKHYEIKRPIILALDNDATGEDKNRRRYNDLKDAGFTVYWNKKFYGDYKDANEFLTRDRDGFIKAIEENRSYFNRYIEEGFNRKQRELFKKHVEESINRPEYPTGFKTLDSPNFLNGGLQPALYGIGAVSSLGKTSFVLQLTDNLASQGIPVLYFSLEMSRFELMAKSISRYLYEYTYVPGERGTAYGRNTMEILDRKRQKDFSDYQLELIDGATDMYFNDTGDTLRIVEGMGNMSVSEIRQEAQLQTDITGRAPIIVLDYLQLLTQPDNLKHSITEKQLLDYNIMSLKRISRDLNTPTIFISSFNRDSYEKSAGDFKSFMGSAGIEYGADVLISLERNITLTEKQARQEGKEEFFYKQNLQYAKAKEKETGVKWLRARILKNRNGQAGGVVGLKFDARNNHFLDYGEIFLETGTTEDVKQEMERHEEILKGRTTIQESPEPAEVMELI